MSRSLILLILAFSTTLNAFAIPIAWRENSRANSWQSFASTQDAELVHSTETLNGYRLLLQSCSDMWVNSGAK